VDGQRRADVRGGQDALGVVRGDLAGHITATGAHALEEWTRGVVCSSRGKNRRCEGVYRPPRPV
jgi:hypothetical protein